MNAHLGTHRRGSGLNRGLLRGGTLTVLLAWAVLTSRPSSLAAQIKVERGDVAPAISLRSAEGKSAELKDYRGRVVIVLFGETNHHKTEQACVQISSALKDATFLTRPVTWLVVLSKGSDPAQFDTARFKGRHPPIVLHDDQRKSFGAYEIVVMPSIIIVDPEGKIVHAMAGYTPRFGDIVLDALHLALGRITEEEFERTLHPSAEVAPDANHLRASRIIGLAEQLARRSMHDLAASGFRDALELVPDSMPALLGLGNVLIESGLFDEAEKAFRAALVLDPDSQASSLGLAMIYAYRGSGELERGEEIVLDMLKDEPSSPRAHYVLGLIHEQRGDLKAAASEYRTAAELLFKQLTPASRPNISASNGRSH